MRTLALDISLKNSGYALFDDKELIEHGSIAKRPYKNHTKDKYPQSTFKFGKQMAEDLADIVKEFEPNRIIIEELIIRNRPGKFGTIGGSVKGIKGLAQIHSLFFDMIPNIDIVKYVTVGEWRKKVGLKKGIDWKKSAMSLCKKRFGIKVKDDDEADAILIGWCGVK